MRCQEYVLYLLAASVTWLGSVCRGRPTTVNVTYGFVVSELRPKYMDTVMYDSYDAADVRGGTKMCDQGMREAIADALGRWIADAVESEVHVTYGSCHKTPVATTTTIAPTQKSTTRSPRSSFRSTTTMSSKRSIPSSTTTTPWNVCPRKFDPRYTADTFCQEHCGPASYCKCGQGGSGQVCQATTEGTFSVFCAADARGGGLCYCGQYCWNQMRRMLDPERSENEGSGRGSKSLMREGSDSRVLNERSSELDGSEGVLMITTDDPAIITQLLAVNPPRSDLQSDISKSITTASRGQLKLKAMSTKSVFQGYAGGSGNLMMQAITPLAFSVWDKEVDALVDSTSRLIIGDMLKLKADEVKCTHAVSYAVPQSDQTAVAVTLDVASTSKESQTAFEWVLAQALYPHQLEYFLEGNLHRGLVVDYWRGYVPTVRLVPSTFSPNPDTSSHSGLSSGAIVGIVLGSIVGFLIILWIVIIIYRRHRQQKKEEYAEMGASATSGAADSRGEYEHGVEEGDDECRSSGASIVSDEAIIEASGVEIAHAAPVSVRKSSNSGSASAVRASPVNSTSPNNGMMLPIRNKRTVSPGGD